MTETTALQWAGAIVRLTMLKRCAKLRMDGDCLEIEMVKQPLCRCCDKPLNFDQWFRSLARGFELEIRELVRQEQAGDQNQSANPWPKPQSN